jgi:site-specific DNA-methyltransferase (adenine-specific)
MKRMPEQLIDVVITSPPYWNLRDYGHDEQIGLEQTYQEYLENLVNIFQQLQPKIKETGAAWINLGDTYSTISGNMRAEFSVKSEHKNAAANKVMNIKQPKTKLKSKSLIGIPDRFKIMMIDAGWICRNDIIWHKPNAMPSSANDRFTVDYERFFFFTKNTKYYFKQQFEPYTNKEEVEYRKLLRAGKDYNLKEPYKKNSPYTKIPKEGAETYKLKGKNKRTVWTINTKPNPLAHFASYPEELISTPIKACCPENGFIYDPFMGSGTTAIAAIKHNRNFIGSEIASEYCDIANQRIKQEISQADMFRTIDYQENL